MAIIGTAMANKRKGMHCIVSSVEHSSVKEPFNFLEENGFEVTYLPVDENGLVSIQDLKEALENFLENSQDKPKRVFCSYTAMLEIRRQLEKTADVKKVGVR